MNATRLRRISYSKSEVWGQVFYFFYFSSMDSTKVTSDQNKGKGTGKLLKKLNEDEKTSISRR
jgi:hypothetical protein